MGIFDIFKESEEKKQARLKKRDERAKEIKAKSEERLKKINEKFEKFQEKSKKKLEENKKRGEEIQKELEKSIRKFNELRHTCPICGNKEDFTAFKNGYGVGKGLVGAAIFGPLGFTAGMIGQNKIYLVCNKCGHKMKV